MYQIYLLISDTKDTRFSLLICLHFRLTSLDNSHTFNLYLDRNQMIPSSKGYWLFDGDLFCLI